MTPNPTKSVKYQQIMDTARDLFWKHGISRVSVTEICREAGVSKMTFYRHFESKVDLARKAMEVRTEEAWKKYGEIMAQDIPYKDKMEQMILMKFEGTKDLSEELIMDIYKNPDLGLMPFIEQETQKSMKILMEDYQKAQQKGEIRQDLNLMFIPYFMGKMQEMISDPALRAMYPTPTDLIKEIFQFFLYGIMPRE